MRTDQLHTWYIQMTDQCTHTCAHCFSSCSPSGQAVLPFSLLRKWIHQLATVTRKRLVFTGGEPFLHFAMLRNLVHEAVATGFFTSVWTNGFWITEPDVFRLTLRYLTDVGLAELIISDDEFHGKAPFSTWKDRLLPIAQELGVKLRFASVVPKIPDTPPDFFFEDHHVLVGPVMHRGRAATTCTSGQNLWQVSDFDTCPFLSFESPHTLFIDAYGLLNICPGFPLADLKQISIKRFLAEFDIQQHPMASIIAIGGPAALAQKQGIAPSTGFVDYCHACWTLRQKFITSKTPL